MLNRLCLRQKAHGTQSVAISAAQKRRKAMTTDELAQRINELIEEARAGGLSDEAISVALEHAAEFLDDSADDSQE
jgi:hypothetical protein